MGCYRKFIAVIATILVIKVDRQLLKESLADSYYSADASQRSLKR